MKRTLSALFVSILLGMGLISCGGSAKAKNTSGLIFRAFVSNPLQPSNTGGGFPALDIVDATKDVLSPFSVSLSGTVSEAGLMVESPKRDRTVVFSPSGNAVAIVSNATESASGSVTLPGATESMFVGSDNATLFVAIPTAPVAGQPAGEVDEVNISTGAIIASVAVPGAHYVVPSPSGNQILVLSDSTNTVTILAPSLVSTGSALTTVSGIFDKPVWAVFSTDGATAYVMNCGAECGGAAASVAIVDMTKTPPAVTSQVTVRAATTGLLSGSTLYVAGTKPPPVGTDCQANLCGALSVLAAGSGSVASTVPITDGYHDHIVMSQNGQLFVGSRTCSNVIASASTPARGCLSIFNTGTGAVATSAVNGDVTGIEPILNRNVVYVCQGGGLTIYDTTTDQPQKTQVTITGQAIDVKLADF